MKRCLSYSTRSYRDTLLLPKTDFPLRPDHSKQGQLLERNTQRLYDWQRDHFKDEFILHDGPPYANGDLHIGHALNKILKDIIIRKKVLEKRRVHYRPGWDCHGLPIELKAVDRGKGIRADAQELAEGAVKAQSRQFQSMAIMADWARPYLTMDPSYEKDQLNVFEKMVKSGLIYRANKPVYWSPSSRTALAEAELEYRDDHVSHAAYILFPFSDGYLMIWTTTPWTIPANRVIAVNVDLEYVMKRIDGKYAIIAAALADKFEGAVVRKYKGSDLVGLEYRDCLGTDTRRVVAAEFVSSESGTGLVHCAPGHGQDDYLLCKAINIEPFSPVDEAGRYTSEAGNELVGLDVQTEGSRKVIAMLKDRGVLVKVERYKHKYPYDWRTKQPVILRATSQLFASLESIKAPALAALNDVKMIPASGRARLESFIRGRNEWCISRQRAWGVPIPEGKGTDTLDVWFDSGCSWCTYEGVADVCLEGTDQHRGWFQSSLLTSIATRSIAPYKIVITHGFVLDAKGRKMSKSIGNVIDPMSIIEGDAALGVDTLRLWVAQSDYTSDVTVSPTILKHVSESLRKIRSTIRFLLGNIGYDQVEPLEIDRYAMHKSEEFRRLTDQMYAEYSFNKVVSQINQYTNSFLSSFYFDTLKDRLYANDSTSISRRSAQTALLRILKDYLVVLAPICPLIVTEAWQYLPEKEHIYASDWADQPRVLWSQDDEKKWTRLMVIRSEVNRLLEQARSRKMITSSLQADVSMPNCGIDMANFLIVSHVSPQCSGEAIASGHAAGIDITIHKAAGKKCPRCWQYTAEDDLCGRCSGIVRVD